MISTFWYAKHSTIAPISATPQMIRAFLPTLSSRMRPAFVSSFVTILPKRTPATTPRRPFSSLFTGALLSAAILPLAVFADSTCPSKPAMKLSDLSDLKDIEGNTLSSGKFDGKVVFAMNVASACGYTNSGYDLFKRLIDKYSPDEFVAVAIPCNSFGWQENGSPEEIKSFALARADKLVITERSDVNGAKQHPIVNLAKSKFPGRISWNFDGRYVFNRNGEPVARFGNSATPDEIEAAIDAAL